MTGPVVTRTSRQEKAIAAAVAVARQLGMTDVDPVILKDSNHTTIHLAPFPVVARVVTSMPADAAEPVLARELSIARHLAHVGAPTVEPTTAVSAGPHREGDVALTLWQFVAHEPLTEDDGLAAAETLQAVHARLATYSGPLPSFTTLIASCRGILEGPEPLALDPADRTLLIAVIDEELALLRDLHADAIVLHGDPHIGNALMTSGGPRWTDWESACVGPLEWDLSCLPETALTTTWPVNDNVLAVLRNLRSACVTVWCSVDPDRAPEKREAAVYHLDRLRRGHGSRPR